MSTDTPIRPVIVVGDSAGMALAARTLREQGAPVVVVPDLAPVEPPPPPLPNVSDLVVHTPKRHDRRMWLYAAMALGGSLNLPPPRKPREKTAADEERRLAAQVKRDRKKAARRSTP